jgi:hypothetical protein
MGELRRVIPDLADEREARAPSDVRATVQRPFFPPPMRREPYRSTARQPAANAEENASAARPVAKRPEPEPMPAETRTREGDDRVRQLVEDENTFWTRHSAFARHPRLIGVVVAAAGAAMTWSSLGTLLRGGLYSVKGALPGPLALAAGLWPAAFGFPLVGGRPPSWWRAGYGAVCAAGGALGLTLLILLAR